MNLTTVQDIEEFAAIEHARYCEELKAHGQLPRLSLLVAQKDPDTGEVLQEPKILKLAYEDMTDRQIAESEARCAKRLDVAAAIHLWHDSTRVVLVVHHSEGVLAGSSVIQKDAEGKPTGFGPIEQLEAAPAEEESAR